MHRITLPATNERKLHVRFVCTYKIPVFGASRPKDRDILIMTYNLNIDQEFAVVNDLSLVQVATLAAFMTLPIWSKTVAIDGSVWYQYSDEKMAEDFPLLFGIPKRCYKNISELCALGFVELTKLGRTKYVRFTNSCADWGKGKEQIRSNGPKTDQEQTENGPAIGPKTDRTNIDYNINNDNVNDKAADGGLFPGETGFVPVVVTRPRRTSEPACLFADSRFADYEKFAAEFDAPEFDGVDLVYYFHAVSDWSSRNGKKQKDWIATARNFMRNDKRDGKLVKVSTDGGALSPDAVQYLSEMAQ